MSAREARKRVMKESDLYPPLKHFLEAQSYEVKGEIGDCDVLAVRGAEAPVIVELKLTLNLNVVLQAVERLSVTPKVYIGVPKQCSVLSARRKHIVKLLRMLGVGLVAIDARRGVEILLDPGEYQPRKSKHRHERLLGEFRKRVGDPNPGGLHRRGGVVTAYRQQALKIAGLLQQLGPSKASDIARALQVPNARAILYRDVYGWFERASVGIYALSPRGQQEVPVWNKQVTEMQC